MLVKCYGRTYEAFGNDYQTLLELLRAKQLARANRWRIGATWPRGRGRKRIPESNLWHEKNVELRTGGALRLVGEFDIATLGEAERQLVSAISDAIRSYEALEPATKQAAVDPVEPRSGDRITTG